MHPDVSRSGRASVMPCRISILAPRRAFSLRSTGLGFPCDRWNA